MKSKKNNKKYLRMFLVLFLIILSHGFAHSEKPEKSDRLIRIMNERAAKITRLKNAYVIKILDSYQIPYQLNGQSVIINIKVDNKWNDVKRIEIVPEIRYSATGSQLVTHNIYFHSNSGILHLASDVNPKNVP